MFDSAFLAKLERLHLLSRRTFHGQTRAERRSHHLGSSLEFADHRPYSPGDDLRSLDWNIYGRSNRLFLKRFEEEGDLNIHLLIDASGSMRWTPTGDPRHPGPRPSKFDLARRLAGALAYLALANLDRVSLQFFSATLGDNLPSGRGKSHFRRVLDFLGSPPGPSAPTSLTRSLRAFARRTKRRGLVLVFSDFFDPHGYEEALNLLLYQRFELQLVHLLDPADIHPGATGDLRLTDSETGNSYEMTVTKSLQRAYEQEISTFLSGLEAFCRRRQIGYRQAMTDAPFEDFVLQSLRGRDPLVR